jgi:hypothetical protein
VTDPGQRRLGRAARLDVTANTVYQWRIRYRDRDPRWPAPDVVVGRLEGLAPGSSRGDPSLDGRQAGPGGRRWLASQGSLCIVDCASVIDSEHSSTDDEHADDATVQPEPVRAKAHIPSVTIVATFTAHGTVTRGTTTTGVEVEHVREIRYSADVEDGVRYVEIVDGQGQHVVSGMGEAADALTAFLLYLLPPDHPDYPGSSPH